MTESSLEFERLVALLRAGDSNAAVQLVEEYESEVRRFIRVRLTTPEIRRWIDSLDVSQSVLSKFFVDVRSGAIEIRDPNQLRVLLLTMARNKLYDHARRQKADKRDARRLEEESKLNYVASSTQTPSQQIANSEIADAILERLSAEDRYMAEQRLSGFTWQELADELGSSADALRKRLSRALDRAAGEIGVL
ncbi:RNA polymerase sigma factor [Bremerella sp. T1]|uniref:RNA polymerase sigma factor n=1 Tax=unclassified Bremerella TaxID=2795601 RepID=UPI001CCE040E|nr:sigma-70 family RNA polymerase sigma factor [Bremerella volcania]UBM36362.1 sigma-70 family RNA polymerase sigma factor [Bremerella volcania]